MNVHVHAIGNASSKAWVDAFAEAAEATGDFDQPDHLVMIVKPGYASVSGRI